MAATDAGGDPDSQPVNGGQVAVAERVARQVFYESAFEDGVVSANALLQFRGNSLPDGSFEESLVCLSMATAQDVHAAGCAVAEKMNQRQQAKREGMGQEPPEPVPGEDRRYYCGFTQAICGDLRIEGDNYNVDLIHKPEDGMDAHVAIFLRPKQGKLHKNDRTEAGRLLALKFADPQAHLCDCDKGDGHHPVIKFGAGVLVTQAA